MDQTFVQWKRQCLSRLDLSKKASVDEHIEHVVSLLNSCEQYFTTSSCSGRIILIDGAPERSDVQKQNCVWLFVSHNKCKWDDVVCAVARSSGEAVLKFEPFVLHAQCRHLDDAQLLISGVELVIFLLHCNSNNLYDQEKVVIIGDCCYVNPMVRRTTRFLGVYVFGLFTTDIFVNAGQFITGSMAPHFLSVCQPNYTALGCQDTGNFVSQSDACTGDPDDIMRARKTFPSKEAALSLYTAVYLAMYVMCCVGSAGGRLTGPILSLSLVSLAVLTGINRVAEYRNHWSDVIAGQAIGGAIAVFLVVFVVQYFKMRPVIPHHPSDAGTANSDETSPQTNHTMDICDKYTVAQSPGSWTEVT
ncbi:phospholipid phosphatase-related protein type 5-like isoform X1 [Sparus aurata]|uniref:tRNA wybutosine-synthesizing protein 3 homolog n=1 Tax=Sparus aurata TaxID=8175 RepID=A0A671UC73_SPAAU|nr:phospholipid phosphatase-related protein type 5-like isoform X1 [Sparus aurata]